MDQSAVGVDDLERLRHSHAATVVSLPLKPDAPGDPQRKPSLLRSTEHSRDGLQKVCLKHWTMTYLRMMESLHWSAHH